MKLREYQQADYDALRRSASMGHKRTIYVAPTGSGKTVVGSNIIKSATDKGFSSWFIVHRRELAEQAHEKLLNHGVDNNIFMSGFRPNLFAPVQVISIATFVARLEANQIPKNTPSMIMVDECHRTMAASYLKLLTMYPEAYTVGLTATPCRSDGCGLGNYYTNMVFAPTIPELIKMGHLVQPKHYSGTVADLTRMRGGNDFVMAELEERQNQPQLVGDVVENWLRLAKGRKTIVFSSGVKHSMAMCEEFEKAGVRAAHIDGNTRTDQRDDILIRHNDPQGDIDVVCNCMVLTEGYDSPIVSCIVQACPTKHIGKYIQTGGRGLRPYGDKADMLLLDHAGLIERHGYLDDPVPWTLDSTVKIKNAVKKVRDQQEKIFVCEECGFSFSGRTRCPECGTALTLHGKPVLATEADLVEWKRGTKAADRPWTAAERQDFYSELLAYSRGDNGKGKEYKEGWVNRIFRAKTGHWPDGMERTCKTPSETTKRYIQHRNIRYAKQREAEKRNSAI